MVDDGKGKKRKGRPTKAAAQAAASTRQRTLRDMFGGGPKEPQAGPSGSQPVLNDVIELSDSEPELLITQPPTPGETAKGQATSALSSLTLLGDDYASPAPKPTSPRREPPKKLFPIFQGRQTRSSVKAVEVLPGSKFSPQETAESMPVTSNHEMDIVGPRSRSPSIQLQEHPKSPTAGSTRDVPIVVEPSSPEVSTTRPPPRPSKPVYSIFNRPPRVVASATKSPALLPPLPTKENQPCDPLIAFPSTATRFFSRRKDRDQEGDARDELKPFLRKLTDSRDTHFQPSQLAETTRHYSHANAHEHIATIPIPHQSIPIISRLLEVAYNNLQPDASSLSEQWAERWRPRQADQVIGNEHHALYLRDWLQALRLQGESLRSANDTALKKGQNKKKRKGPNKKPDVIRHVKRRRRDGHEDDFYAPDDFTESEDELQSFDVQSSDWDDIGFCQEMDAKLNGDTSTDASQASTLSDENPGVHTYKPARFGSSISNTILLAGPSGTGKTAAVYACAAELGWEVFEVYPGIGERSGAELNKLIGDVGKNHTVKVRQSPKKTAAKATFFQKQTAQAKRRSNAMRVCDSEDELDLLREPRPAQPAEDEAIDIVGYASPELAVDPAEPTVNQSVILIEEVDVLYQSDMSFWPALINIIKHCRRPVVLTCNDVSLIPRQDLPLQATLEFRVCPFQMATSYLQAMCIAEKRPLSRESISHTLDESAGDLRHAMQQLQVGVKDSTAPAGEAETVVATPVPQSSPDSSPLTCAESSSPRPTTPHGADAAQEARVLRQMERQHELHSFVDAWLTRGASAIPHAFFADEHRPGADDPLGYTVLDEDVDTDHIPVSPYHTVDTQLACAILDRVRAEATGLSPAADDPVSEQAAYLARVGPLLRAFRAWTVPATDAALHTDYAPWLRYVVAVEEEQRALLAQIEAPGGSQRRRTRNSQKTEQSWLSVNPEERGVLVMSGFSV